MPHYLSVRLTCVFFVLVTGGLDPLIRIWNPYVTNSPITVMKGHVTAVTHVIVSGYRNTILSISKDKV